MLLKFERENLTPQDIHQILLDYKGTYILAKNPSTSKFVDSAEACFWEIHGNCNTIYRDLCSKGIGVEVCHTCYQKKWLYSVLSVTNSKTLQRCVFFYVGKYFCIRGQQKQ